MYHVLYPFLCQWKFRLLPCLGFCKHPWWTLGCMYFSCLVQLLETTSALGWWSLPGIIPISYASLSHLPGYRPAPLIRTLVTGDVRPTHIIQGSLPHLWDNLLSDPYLNHNCKFLFYLVRQCSHSFQGLECGKPLRAITQPTTFKYKSFLTILM